MVTAPEVRIILGEGADNGPSADFPVMGGDPEMEPGGGNLEQGKPLSPQIARTLYISDRNKCKTDWPSTKG